MAETAAANPAGYENISIGPKTDPAKAAAKFRDFLGPTMVEQKSWKPDEAYRNFQAPVESIGIYVFKMKLPMPEIGTFCLTGRFPVIVLNTDDCENGRIFSLFRETIG